MKKLLNYNTINILILLGLVLIILGLGIENKNIKDEKERESKIFEDNIKELNELNKKLYDKYYYEKIQAEYWYYYNIDDAC